MDYNTEKSHMSRRRFIYNTSTAATALVTASSTVAQTNKPLIAGEINNYLNSLGSEWVDFNNTVDGFDSGNPETVVKGIAVAWTPYIWALKRALDLGCNIFVTHETPFYEHRKEIEDKFYPYEAIRKKRTFIEKSNITIIRCHDVWDQYPDIGIPMSWGKFLDLGDPIGGSGWLYVYDGKGHPAVEIARKIASKTAELGQPGVQFMGDENRPVYRIALGCGAITPIDRYLKELKADFTICSDDGINCRKYGTFSADTGFPIVVVNHAVTEDYGMTLMAERFKEAFPGVPVHNIRQHCLFKLINA
ncbi:Nif3-like dinuclear metal center hexameric protein [Candidatus Latescibacterota bacterium]